MEEWLMRGAEIADGTVPVLPLFGIGAVGVGVFAMGVASLRRRRESHRISRPSLGGQPRTES